VADPARADFGTVTRVLAGDPSDAPLGDDYALSSSIGAVVGFGQQHHPTLLADGRLMLFDNRLDVAEVSRAITLSLDDPQGTADIDGEWALPEHCSIQGSVFHTETGNVMATCASPHNAYEYEPTGDAAVWTFSPFCPDGLGLHVPRFQPLDL
jgi:hypothetical protein